MFTNLTRHARDVGAARSGVLLFATGLIAVGADAAIAHFAGRDMKSAAQLIPVIVSPAAFAALLALALRRWPEGLFRKGVRAIGAILAAVGVLGTSFHLAALMRLLEGQPLSMRSLELALAVAPPIGAPGAFIALGGLLWLMASPRLAVELLPRSGASSLTPA